MGRGAFVRHPLAIAGVVIATVAGVLFVVLILAALAGLFQNPYAGLLVFIALPVSPLTVYLFAAIIGFLWLGTVPLTGGLIAHVFGVKYLATLTGIAFLFHQIGSSVGVWLAGYLFDTTGSYHVMWMLTIAMGILAALINLPIDDRQIVRPALKAA